MTVFTTVGLALVASAAAYRYAAVDVAPEQALVPRFFIDEPRLAARDGGSCQQANHHSCADIRHPEYCCANTHYCYIKPDNTPWCCPVGSPCDSQCDASKYQCPSVVAVTISSSGTPTVTSTTSSACCGRTCPSASSFRCEDAFGGGCCEYGATCVSPSGCVRTVSASTSVSALLTPADPGCTATTQHACTDGPGCCDNLMHCTVVSGTTGCAPGNPSATDVNFTPTPDPAGLSSSAKIGIGVGVAVAGCLGVGILAWCCFAKRRQRRSATTAAATSEPRTRAMSEGTMTSRPTALRGATRDYFGPDAVAGPYTETDTVASDHRAAASSPGHHRGVPLQAHSPSDVVAPVEIDSRVGGGHTPRSGGGGEEETMATGQRFELYGSEMASPTSPLSSPPPMTPRSVRSAFSFEKSPVDKPGGKW
ncbi:hypothetical protein Cob_v000526 [Colletotrichum orbiculare MAFF 240422]|uniref:Uncharacterized protein n=1 Tax=Colletotrichum orbiculare (strain 104-T / ATCC 96160 / CBS 514.97 / LARS 414 / MAFF 240422) TaxID=1213857 RepID=N4VIM3_COLOR|nr:hypothetical protein Cob_v000526 [Colletotrichum orbiculare MAFF 240422]